MIHIYAIKMIRPYVRPMLKVFCSQSSNVWAIAELPAESARETWLFSFRELSSAALTNSSARVLSIWQVVELPQ